MWWQAGGQRVLRAASPRKGLCMRPHPRSPKAAGPVAAAGKRQTDRHAMQSEVGYLFSELWRGKGEKSRKADGEGGRNGKKG